MENIDNRHIMRYIMYFRKRIMAGRNSSGRGVGWDSEHKWWVQPWIGPGGGGFGEKGIK